MNNTKEEIILALDQSSIKTGFSIFKDGKLSKYGLFDLHDISKKSDGETAYDEKVENVRMFLERCIKEYNIALVTFEDVQKQLSMQTYKQLSYLQGVLKNYCYSNNIPYAILKPSEWRSVLNIKGRKREEVKANAIKYIKDKFNLDVGEDEAESICIGLATIKLLKKNKLIIYKEI